MALLREVPTNDLIESMAAELKSIKDIAPPEWASYVKTGAHKERPPAREDWWQVRAAAVLRSVEKLGPVGVSKLRTKYGGKKNRGYAPEKFYKGSGNILRKILQQLEKADLVKKEEKSQYKGRIITPAGRKLISNAMREAKKAYSKALKDKEEKQGQTAQPEQKPEPKAETAGKAAPKTENTQKPAAEKGGEESPKKEPENPEQKKNG